LATENPGEEPVEKFALASSGPFSAWRHPAASTIKLISPASPSLPDEKLLALGPTVEFLERLLQTTKADGGNCTIPVNDSRTGNSPNVCAESVQSETFSAQNDPDLAPPDITALADLLTTLPDSDRAGIIADLPQEERLAVARLIAKKITEDSRNE